MLLDIRRAIAVKKDNKDLPGLLEERCGCIPCRLRVPSVQDLKLNQRSAKL